MEQVIEFIKKKNLFAYGSRVGVAVSGGSDSMALLNLLFLHQDELGIGVCAINVNHGTRLNDEKEARFVEAYCSEMGIPFREYKVEANVIAKKEGVTLEDACRKARYGIFEALREKNEVDYIALAHHERDQAETILLHILRGSGLTGASGMSIIRNGYYIRPLLETSKEQVMQYVGENNIPYLEDETNTDTTIARNLLRQEIMPALREVWGRLDATLCSFGKICREDDEYIRKMMNFDSVLSLNGVIKIPLTYFLYDQPIVYRLIADQLVALGAVQDFERKHFDLIWELAKTGENGAKLDLPQNVEAFKEYSYLTLIRKKPKFDVNVEWNFKVGTITFGDYGKLQVKRVKKPMFDAGVLTFDLDRVPNGAKWRVRKEGDVIEKFGGGTKKLKSYLIDKKIPARLRDYLPVLAVGSEVLAVAGVDIAEQLKVTEDTQNFAIIKYDLENWA